MKPQRSTPGNRPSQITLALMAAAIIIGAAIAGRGLEKGSAARIALALVQSVATGAVIVVSILGIRRLDELQQRIHLTALAIAFAGTGVILSGYGWLEAAGLPHVEWGLYTWPLMAGLWAMGFWFANRRYS